MRPERIEPNLRGRLTLVESLVRSTKRGSPARAAAIAEAARKVVLLGHGGQHGRVSERTLRDWIGRYEAKGAAGLIPKARHRPLELAWLLSSDWDSTMEAMCGDMFRITVVANEVRGCIRAVWLVSGARSWHAVQAAVSPLVVALTKATGAPIADEWLDSICRLPRATIERDRPRAARPNGRALRGK